jgi:monoamine oxidase
MSTHHEGQHGHSINRRKFLTAAGLFTAAPMLGRLLGPGTAGASPVANAGSPDEARWQTCLQLARQLLLIGPNGEDLKLQYLKVLIDEGLPKAAHPKKVLIVGAGIAGLAAGWLLKGAGHDVTIIEANDNRIGGRIKTFRQGPERPNGPPPFTDARLYAEAGAMRIPDFHPLVLALVDKLGLKRRLFYNVDVRPGTGDEGAPVPAVTYASFTGAVWRRGPDSTDFRAPDQANGTWIATNGQRVRRADYARDPAVINRGFHMPAGDLDRTTGQLIEAALGPVYDYYSERSASGERVNKPVPQWIEGWARLFYDLDGYSMGEFLAGRAGLATETVEAIGTLENLTSRNPLSFLHSFLTRTLIDPKATYWEIVGGTAQLPYALLPLLADQIRLNRRVIRMEYWDPTRDGSACRHVGKDGPKVWVETTSESGGDEALSGNPDAKTETFTADVAIVTIPFSALRLVDVQPLFSYRKRRAIIELHYDSATKVLLEFRKRWWEFSEADWQRELDAIEPGLYERYRSDQPEASHFFGGGSVTDGPNRFTYYPSHPIEGCEGGVVLASYSWADDASRWDSLDDKERYGFALRGLQSMHGQRVEAFYTGRGQTQSWLRNRYALGEAALFAPGQLTRLHPAISVAEGPVHFAGEHTSLKHSWIEGALESAVRTALEVNAGD